MGIPLLNKTISLIPAEIIRIEASSNNCFIYFASGKKIIAAKVLQWFEAQLPLDIFSRVHRSHLVNMDFVREIKGTTTKRLLLQNGETITVSRRRKQSLKLSA